MAYYIDTSILVSYYCPEPLSAHVQRVVTHLGRGFVSPLVEVELCSALSLKIRTHGLALAAANQVLSLFQQHLRDGNFGVVPVQTLHYDMTRDWISRFSTSLRTLDALHLAVSLTNGFQLLTSDKALAQSARQLGIGQRLVTQ